MPQEPKRQDLLIGSHRAGGFKLLPIMVDGEQLVVVEFFIAHGQRIRIGLSRPFFEELSASGLRISSSEKKAGDLV